MSNYAKLGYGCMTNMDILVSNAKFFPLKSAIYEKPYWKQAQDKPKEQVEENLRLSDPSVPNSKSCCGR